MFNVRDTPRYCQNPGLDTRAVAVEVQKSKRVAVQPPWRLLRRLQCWGSTVKLKRTLGWGCSSEAETSLRLGKKELVHSWEGWLINIY